MKKLQTLLLTVLAMLFIVGYSNAEDRRFRWYIPQWTGVSFDSSHGHPRYMNNHFWELNSWAVNPAVTWDKHGNTLFFTEKFLINREYEIISNKRIHGEYYSYGTSHYGNAIHTMNFPMVVPMPGSDSLTYCIFSFDEGNYDKILNAIGSDEGQYHGADLYYSVIKFDPDYRNCESIVHRQILDTALCHQIALCRHGNGSDVWAVCPKFYDGNYVSYLLTDAGIIDTVVSYGAESTRCFLKKGLIYYHNTFGQMKSTIDGNTIARSLIDSSIVELSNFNKTTGVVSNIKRLKNRPDNKLKWVSSLEFSANGRYLYANGHQFDLELGSEDDLYRNAKRIDLLPVHPGVNSEYDDKYPLKYLIDYQMGPDQKIYFIDKYPSNGHEPATGTLCVLENSNSQNPYVRKHCVAVPLNETAHFSTDLPEY
ncbi:MAG: hypothetical protein KAH48_03600, partial [Chlorobi bacterium]|nr:hypothetical protein [Chlorobiota bacterium]